MTVGTWDGNAEVILDSALLMELLGHWRQFASTGDPEASALHMLLPAPDQARVARIMQRDLADWRASLEQADAGDLVQLLQFFVLAEVGLPGCEAGKKSPAIACARELRRRSSFPPELTRWIRQHSTNRFLPYGSLLD